MGVNNTATLGGAQIGDVNTGVDASSTTTNDSNVAIGGGDVYTNQDVNASGNTAAGAGSSSTMISAGERSTINVTQESAPAIAALMGVSMRALDAMNSTALGSIAFGHATDAEALDLAKKVSQSPFQQIGSLLLPLAIVAGIVLVVYYSKKKG